jgi:hypothetical protein
LVAIPAFFEILSYIPDLVSGELTGLAKSIGQQRRRKCYRRAVTSQGLSGVSALAARRSER